MTDQKKYHINIFSSLWAICPPGYEPFKKICCILPDGTLDEEKYRFFMEEFAACGANNTRCLPFLMNEDWKTVNPEYMPFKMVSGKYELNEFNQVYFDNLHRMAQIANGQGIRFWFTLFSTSHGNKDNSPWVKNNNGIDGFHELSTEFIDEYINKAFDALKGQVFGIECVSEPNIIEMAPLIRDCCLHLVKRGIPKDHIMPGHQFPVEGSLGYVTPVYTAVKKELKRTGFHDDAKDDYYSKVIHGMTRQLYKAYAHTQKHTSRMFFSNDGLKPRWDGWDWIEALLAVVGLGKYAATTAPASGFFGEVSPDKNKQLELPGMGIEHLCTIPSDSTEEEEKAIRQGALGISKAYEEYTGIKLYSIGDEPEPIDPKPSIEDRVTSLEKRVSDLEKHIKVNTMTIDNISSSLEMIVFDEIKEK